MVVPSRAERDEERRTRRGKTPELLTKQVSSRQRATRRRLPDDVPSSISIPHPSVHPTIDRRRLARPASSPSALPSPALPPARRLTHPSPRRRRRGRRSRASKANDRRAPRGTTAGGRQAFDGGRWNGRRRCDRSLSLSRGLLLAGEAACIRSAAGRQARGPRAPGRCLLALAPEREKKKRARGSGGASEGGAARKQRRGGRADPGTGGGSRPLTPRRGGSSNDQR
jgi:hypothetical protein